MRRTPLGEGEKQIALTELLRMQEIGQFPDTYTFPWAVVYYESIMPALSTFLKLAFKPVFDGKSRLKDTRLLSLS